MIVVLKISSLYHFDAQVANGSYINTSLRVVVSKCKIRIKTLAPLESPHSGFFNGAIFSILILHFNA